VGDRRLGPPWPAATEPAHQHSANGLPGCRRCEMLRGPISPVELVDAIRRLVPATLGVNPETPHPALILAEIYALLYGVYPPGWPT
jgi:hypothetical protein